MATLTVKIDTKVKMVAQELSQRNGTTLTFIVNQLLRNYIKGDISFFLEHKANNYDAYLADDQRQLIDFQQSAVNDSWSRLDPLSEEEYNYYSRL